MSLLCKTSSIISCFCLFHTTETHAKFWWHSSSRITSKSMNEVVVYNPVVLFTKVWSLRIAGSDEAYAPVDPCTPECQRVGGHGLGVILSPVHALVDSPLPAKRLYSEAWASTNPVQVCKTGPKNSRLSLSRLVIDFLMMATPTPLFLCEVCLVNIYNYPPCKFRLLASLYYECMKTVL